MRTAAAVALICLLAPSAALPQEAIPPTAAGSSTGAATGTTAATGTPASAASPSAPAAAAPAAAAPAKPDALPVDSATQWRVGVSVFSVEGLSADNAYLAYSLPLLLRNEVSGLGSHRYQDAERDLLRRSLVQGEAAAAEKTLTAAQRDHDALLFDRVPEGAPSRVSVQTRLTAARARLDFLDALDPARIDVTDGKPVTFPRGSGPGDLLPAPRVPPAVYCAQNQLDLLVGGTLSEVEGYLLLDIWAYDPLSRTNAFSSRNAASRDELYATMPAFGDEIARTILGRPWALVAFAPDPPSADLYVDGKRVASGATPALYLSPGDHGMRLSATGYADSVRSLFLEEGKVTRVSDSLVKISTGEISITSLPTGADLYVDSRWMGKTPLSVDRPPLRSRGVLSLDGFYNTNFSVAPSSPSQLTFSLEKDVGSKDELQKKARDDFYSSLGFFAFSLPLPVFSYALLIDSQIKQVDLRSQGFATAADREKVNGTLLQGTYYVGVALSAALFTWMVTRILSYVKVANEIAG